MPTSTRRQGAASWTLGSGWGSPCLTRAWRGGDADRRSSAVGGAARGGGSRALTLVSAPSTSAAGFLQDGGPPLLWRVMIWAMVGY